MRQKIIFLLFSLMVYVSTNAQGVGIGTNSPSPGAALDISSTTGSLLLPRMTTTQRDALTPTPGMVIQNTSVNAMQAYSTFNPGGNTVNDQSQLTSQTSYSSPVAQSFTAGVSGNLYSVTILVSLGSGSGTLSIRNGAGTGGEIIHSQSIIFTAASNTEQEFIITTPCVIASGSVYTFEFIGPVWLGVSTTDPYAGGQVSSNPFLDLYFKTKILTSPSGGWKTLLAGNISNVPGTATLLPSGNAAGNTLYWNGASWVSNSSNIFNNGGNVGIGTFSPVNKLSVSGNADFTGNVGIGTSTPNTGAALDISSTTGSLLLPRMTTTQRDALTPTAGMMIQNTTLNEIQAYSTSNPGGSINIDQSQTTYSTSSCPSIGTSRAQSFTAGASGSLYSVTLFGSGSTGSFTLNIRNGAGIGGEIIYSQSIFIGSVNAEYEITLSSTPGITSGSVYTIECIGTQIFCNTALRYSYTNTYAGGQYYSAGVEQTGDLYFKTKIMSLPSGGWQTLFAGTATSGAGIGSLLPPGDSPGNTIYWNGSSWVTNSGNIFNNGSNVGIGTASPSNKLTVSGNADFTGNVGIGTSSPSNKLTVSGNADFTGNVGVGTSSPSNKLSVSGNANITGYVGIGTTSPSAPLHITTTAGLGSMGTGYIFNASGLGGSYSGGNTASILATGTVIGGNFFAVSDARVKQIVGVSNSTNDLALLNKLKVTDYTYIDKVVNDTRLIKKVIAQDVEQVLPNAVSKSKNFIPNVYALAVKTALVNGKLHITVEKPHGLKTGDKLRWIDEKETEQQSIVTAIISPNSFEIDYATNSAKAFIYGKEVNDFRTVDYEAISMLNVSATQELYKMIVELKTENEKLKKENNSFKEDITEIKRKLNMDRQITKTTDQ